MLNIDTSKLSPMMKHYFQIKAENPDVLIMYRLGDFYELFFDDAKIASEVLDITLTGRDCGISEKAPMCGVPFHSADSYIAKLVNNGYKVGICEQLTKPGEQKGIVKRALIRIISKSSMLDNEYIDKTSNNFCLSITKSILNYGIAWADLSTGDMWLYEMDDNFEQLLDFILLLNPTEIVLDENLKNHIDDILKKFDNNILINTAKTEESVAKIQNTFIKLFNIKTLDIFEINSDIALIAASILLNFYKTRQMQEINNLKSLKMFSKNEHMILDQNTLKNLELFESVNQTKKGSLLWVLNECKTSMGSRYLKRALQFPLQQIKLIEERYSIIDVFFNNKYQREQLREMLGKIFDVERIMAKLCYNQAQAKDLLALKSSFIAANEIKILLQSINSPLLHKFSDKLPILDEIAIIINEAISDDPPSFIRDGNFIKKGFYSKLDEIRDIRINAHEWMLKFSNEIKEKYGIKNLKISYNKIFGYYIEVPKSQSAMLPDEFIRKQTTVNAERFTNESLSEMETKILTSQEEAVKLELEIFEEIINKIKKEKSNIDIFCNIISELDLCVNLAHIAKKYNYVKADIVDSKKPLIIKDGRHPVVERLVSQEIYVSNDTYLNNDDNLLTIITGPNMAGKSTYMRQCALIVLLAHIGSYVPASSAQIPICDRIFTRIGANDNLSKGQSTFMLEMVELSTILKNATDKSLIIIDEIGRGTSTIDGYSIAWATIEYIVDKIRAKTLFSTHFHELNKLDQIISNIKSYRIMVSEVSGKIIFLHKIEKGGTDKSYGIEVAAICGLPDELVYRAKEISDKTENESSVNVSNKEINYKNDDAIKLSIIKDKIKNLDMDLISPFDAYKMLKEIKEKL